MGHRDEIDALRSKAEALESERDEIIARADRAERALRAAEARIVELETAIRLGQALPKPVVAEVSGEADRLIDHLRDDLEDGRPDGQVRGPRGRT